MAGIFGSNGVWSMGFDMAPTGAQIFGLGSSGTGAVTSPVPFGSGYSYSCNGQNGIALGVNLTTLFCGFRYYGGLANSNILCGWYDNTAGAYQVSLRIFSDGHLQFYQGIGTGTTLGSASAAGLLTANTWVYIETKVTISTTVGVVECRINGNATPVITASSLNTQPTANTWVNAFWFQNPTGAVNYDDWYMLDTTASSPLNTYLGNVQVKGDKPSANSAVGGRNAYTPTNPTNVNFTNVGNVPVNTAEYNSDATAGDYDMFKFPAISASTVFFLNEWVQIELDAAGVRTVGLDCYSASGTATDSLGTAFTPNAGTVTLYNNTYIKDPSGPTTWTAASAGNAELGIKTIT